jgi:hypothetical protein
MNLVDMLELQSAAECMSILSLILRRMTNMLALTVRGGSPGSCMQVNISAVGCLGLVQEVGSSAMT